MAHFIWLAERCAITEITRNKIFACQTQNTLAHPGNCALTLKTSHVFFSIVKYNVFYCNWKEQTLAMNIQTRSRKSEYKHSLYTFTVWFQCNTHKYLLLFHRVNIQLTVTPQKRDTSTEEIKWEKNEVLKNEKVDDREEKLQLDTVCLNTTIWASTPHSQTGHLSTVQWQVVNTKLNFQSSCLRPCGGINPHSSGN